MKRFALLCQHFYPEMVSTGMHMTELASRLSEMGWQITVYCARPSWGVDTAVPVPKVTSYQGVQIIRVPTVGNQQKSLLSRTLFALSFLLATGWEVWRHRHEFPGLVLTTNPPFLGILGWLFSHFLRKPYLLIVYDVYPDIAVNLGLISRHSLVARIWELATRLIFRHAEVLVVIGRDMAKIVRDKVPVERHGRITLIPNWSDERCVQPVSIESNTFRQEQGLDGQFVVQYAGRMGRTHNLEPLIETARIMIDEPVLFQFVGEGAKKAKLEALVEQHGLNNVTFLPYQPMGRLAEMLSAADLAVVCLDSAFTGLSVPSKTYGILASGTPILGFLNANSEIGQLIKETGSGFVLEKPNSTQIASIIRTLRDDAQKRNDMGCAGRKTFLDHYTLAHAAEAYDRSLTTMLIREPSKNNQALFIKRNN